jgi:uncharacterized protein YjiS (DUF1127 family)
MKDKVNFQMRNTKMKLIQFAVASIVDANTGHGLVHRSGKIDYPAAEQRGHRIRAHSISDLVTSISKLIGKVKSIYQARAELRRDLGELSRLNEHQLRDIGVSRGDLFEVEMGNITLVELNARRHSDHARDGLNLIELNQVGAGTQQRQAVNERLFNEAKCA